MSETPKDSSGAPDMEAMTSDFLQMLEKNQQAFAKLIATPPDGHKDAGPFQCNGFIC